jgi:outer membrane usher protein FimD/PapC
VFRAVLLTGLCLASAAALLPDAVAADPPGSTSAFDPTKAISLVLQLMVNGVPKGDVFAYRTEQGKILLRRADLVEAGVKTQGAPVVMIDRDEYIAADALPGVTASFDTSTLALALDVDPALLGKQVIDLAPKQPTGVLEPTNNSAFFNYLVDYNWTDAGQPALLSVDGGLGVRAAGILAFTDGRCEYASGSSRCIRGFSNLTYDSREDLQRYVAGDFLASSGQLGSTLNLGGLSLSKFYAINPYLIIRPFAAIEGTIARPGEAQVLIDGLPVTTQKLRPGPFEFQDINYFGGARNVEVIVRDASGREQIISSPFYFTTALLREGLEDYSYNIGFLREDFRVASNRYSKAGMSFFYRYGVTDSLTLGVRGEATETEGNAGPEIGLGLGPYGVVNAAASVSYDDNSNNTGYAGVLGYEYQRVPFNASTVIRAFDKNYVFAGQTPPDVPSFGGDISVAFRPVQPKFEFATTVSYGFLGIGTLGLAYANLNRYQGPDRETIALTFSASPLRNVSLFGSVGHTREFQSGIEFFFGLSWFPDRDYTANYTQRRQVDGFQTSLAQVGKRVPVGEGLGFNVAYERSGIGGDKPEVVSPFVQYNGAYATYLASARLGVGGPADFDLYRVGTAGTIAYVDGMLSAARPIADSFAVVRIPDVEGVRVYQNNQEIARTDASGSVFVPTLSSYFVNQIRIDDRDIPIDYALEETTILVSPPLRSGSAVVFPVKKIQAVVGTLKVSVNGVTRPMDYGEVVLRGDSEEYKGPVGRGGEIYLENVPPGDYTLSAAYEGQTCRTRISIPESKEIILRLGDVVCTLE